MASDAVDKANEEVKRLEESFGSLAAAMINVREIKFMKVNAQLKDITKVTTTTGRIWLAMARVISGSGLWKLQNKVKAWADWLRFREQMAQKAVEKEQALIKEFGMQMKYAEALLLLETKIDKLGTNQLSQEEQTTVLQDERIRYLMKMMPFEMAKAQMVEDTKDTLKKIEESTKNFDKKRIKNMKIFLKGKDDELMKLGEFNALSREQKVVAMDLMDIQAEREKLYGQMSDDEKDAFNLRAIKTEDRAKELGVTADDAGKLTGTKGPSWKEKLKGRMHDFGIRYGSDSADREGNALIDNKAMKSFFKDEFPGAKMWKFISKGGIKKGLKNFFSPERMDSMKATAKSVRNMIGKIMLGIGLAVVAVMSLKKLGIFDLLKDMAGTVMETLGKMWERGGKLLTSAGEWVSSIIELFHALFNGSSGEAWEALKKFGSASLDLLLKFGSFALGWIYDLVVGFGKNIIDWGKKEFGKGRNLLVSIADALFTFLAFHYTRLFVANMLPDGVKYAGAIALVGGLGAAATTHSAFADGGITGNGWSLVGERGPELVRLPAGSRVFSNADSQRMGNNITVNVQGRVGASDAEVRDIANKIGRLVNSQINRNVTTGIRGA
tara:strand:- start:2097 stop:3926 length:1830 start_codon:yes stop_codon:yes gene_type:complete